MALESSCSHSPQPLDTRTHARTHIHTYTPPGLAVGSSPQWLQMDPDHPFICDPNVSAAEGCVPGLSWGWGAGHRQTGQSRQQLAQSGRRSALSSVLYQLRDLGQIISLLGFGFVICTPGPSWSPSRGVTGGITQQMLAAAATATPPTCCLK